MPPKRKRTEEPATETKVSKKDTSKGRKKSEATMVEANASRGRNKSSSTKQPDHPPKKLAAQEKKQREAGWKALLLSDDPDIPDNLGPTEFCEIIAALAKCKCGWENEKFKALFEKVFGTEPIKDEKLEHFKKVARRPFQCTWFPHKVVPEKEGGNLAEKEAAEISNTMETTEENNNNNGSDTPAQGKTEISEKIPSSPKRVTFATDESDDGSIDWYELCIMKDTTLQLQETLNELRWLTADSTLKAFVSRTDVSKVIHHGWRPYPDTADWSWRAHDKQFTEVIQKCLKLATSFDNNNNNNSKPTKLSSQQQQQQQLLQQRVINFIRAHTDSDTLLVRNSGEGSELILVTGLKRSSKWFIGFYCGIVKRKMWFLRE